MTITEKEHFHDRINDLAFFREKYKKMSKGELIVFYGRRRLGKTKLINKFLEEVDSKKIYSFVNLTEEKEVMKSFENDILRHTQDVVKIDSWRDYFEYLHAEAHKSKIVVVIDEFQRFQDISPGFISELQNFWDLKLKNSSIMLVIVGSSVGMMQKIAFSSSGVLYGRKTGQIQLKPFRYVDFRGMFADRTEEEKIKWFSVFGGTPHYLEIVHKIKDINEAILKFVLEKNAPLRDEPKNLLEFELRVIARYNSIVQAIAQHKYTVKEISDSTGIPSEVLMPYLNKLIDLITILVKKEPILGKEKSSKYMISDNFFKFWYRFVFPNQSTLELGNTKEVLSIIDKDLSSYIGYVFEDIVKELFILYNQNKIKDITLNFTNIGSWWDRKSNEIDLVIENKNGLILGEIECRNKMMDADIIKELIKKMQFVNYHGKIKFVLISKSGFTDSCKKLALETNTTLLDLKDIENLFDAAPKD